MNLKLSDDETFGHHHISDKLTIGQSFVRKFDCPKVMILMKLFSEKSGYAKRLLTAQSSGKQSYLKEVA